MAIVISSDEIKKQIPDYSPNKAEDFHRESTKQADKLFTKTLKESVLPEVILLSGGAASGKTEFLSTHLITGGYIVFDSTLDTPERAKIKLRQIIKFNKTPKIYAIIPDDLRRAFVAFLSRDRKFSDEHFYRTHSGSRQVLLSIVLNYSNIEVNIIESYYSSEGKLHFLRIEFDNKEKLTSYLLKKQLTENDIINIIKG